MPSWKKLIQSGSNAELNEITASGNVVINKTGATSNEKIFIINEDGGEKLSLDEDGDLVTAGGIVCTDVRTTDGIYRGSDPNFDTSIQVTQNGIYFRVNPAGGFDTETVALFDDDKLELGTSLQDVDVSIANDLMFADYGTQKVGIGNTTPTEKLVVGGNISASGNVKVDGNLLLTGSGNLYGSSSYLNIVNDTTAPSEIRLNCEANTHYVGIRGPVHSGASSYVLKLPNGAPSDDQILKVNGSPSGGEVTLAWEDDGGGGGVSFPTTSTISSSTDLFIGKTDGAFVSASTGNVEISGSGRGQLEVDYRVFDTGSSHLSSAGGGVGDIVKFGGSSTTAGDIYYLKTNGTWDEAQANAGGTASSSLAVALGSNSTTDGMLLKGMVKLDEDPTADIGAPIYLDASNAGHGKKTPPGSSGNFVRIVGHYYGNSGLIYFNPDSTFIEVA